MDPRFEERFREQVEQRVSELPPAVRWGFEQVGDAFKSGWEAMPPAAQEKIVEVGTSLPPIISVIIDAIGTILGL